MNADRIIISADNSEVSLRMIIAHRGGAAEALENSPAAIRHAMAVGCDSLEVDLRATRDNEIVVMHDASINRTTLGKGPVKDFTLQELQAIKLKNNETIPTLQDVLRLTQNKIGLHLEVKEPGFEKKLVEILAQFQLQQPIFIISFYPEILSKIHDLNLQLKTGFIFAKAQQAELAPDFCSLLMPQADLVNEKLLQTLKSQGKIVHAWVVNEPDKAQKLLAMGIDGIATDCPQALKS